MNNATSRRSVLLGSLGALGLATGHAALGGRAAAAPSPGIVDAIVVGAGLSGLAAAERLAQSGASVLVLEARDRAGGRVHNIRSPRLGATLDAGAEFIGPTQDHIAALAARYDVRTIPTYNEGDSLFWHDGTGTRVPAALPLPLHAETLRAAAGLISAQTSALMPFPVGQPWLHPDAARLDSMTWGQFSRQTADTELARALMQVAMSAPLSVGPEEVSALYFVNYIAASGNEREPGTLLRLLGTSGGAQESLFEGGAALIPLRMAAALGDRVVLDAPVRSITHSATGVEVDTDAGVFHGRRVIVAMSPAISGRIRYAPDLPAARIGLTDGYRMGAVSKFAALYRRPFWREQGMSGQVYGNGRPIDVTFESYAENRHILMGFISADAMRRLDHASEAQIARECLANFVDYFGPEAADPLDHGIYKWDLDPWARGGPVGVSSPGTLTRFGPALRDPVGPIHWAGTETSDYWTGYMDGAVRSGLRAADEVLTALS